jgi:ribose transport system ATP-binding protein
MSDKIIVMCDGRITGQLNVSEATQDIILGLATKYQSKKEAAVHGNK